MLHRAASLLVAAFMLHLNAVPIERACAAPPPTEAHQHGHGQHQSESRSEMPVCCDSLGACALSFELSSDRAVAELAPQAECRVPSAESRPSSPARAPDPPPPKA